MAVQAKTAELVVRQAFSKFVDERTLLEIERGEAAVPPAQSARIGYNLVMVQDETAAEARKNIGDVLTVVEASGGRLEEVLPPLVLVVFGGSLPSAHPQWRSKTGTFATALRDKLDGNVKILYGQADCLEGSLGQNRLFRFSATIPKFGSVIADLCAMEFGSCLQVDLVEPGAAAYRG